MSDLTNEQIQAILDGAPLTLGGFVNGFDCGDDSFFEIRQGHNLADLKEILTLRQEVERLKSQQSEVATHPDDEAIHQFACSMKGKMAASRAKGREGWETCDPYSLAKQFVEHLTRCNDGNYLDLANYCMMLHQRGESPIKLAQMISRMKDEVAARAVVAAATEFGRPNITATSVGMFARDYASRLYSDKEQGDE